MKTKLIHIPRPADIADEADEADEPEDTVDAIIESHPDGYYWVSVDGRRSFGPFASAQLARADRDRGADEAPEPGESLEEAEGEIGIADWINPDTGVPAEGLSTPHLVDD